jgi:(heptosyl)LPS beta-1,4-glucosyltransferase
MTAFNEEAVIAECLESVKTWASEIIVVDGSSHDRTVEIARAYTPNVLSTTNKLMLNLNKNRAIDAATCEWVLLLDPDERVSAELASEVSAIAESGERLHSGYWIPRRNLELGRWLQANDWQLRLFRNGEGRFPCRHIHEFVALSGSVGRLQGILLHTPRQSLFEYAHKRNLYSEHWATFAYEQGAPFRLHKLLLRPLYDFLEHYFLRGRWRDGTVGLVIGISEAHGTFLQHAKLWQKWQARATASDSESAESHDPVAQSDARRGPTL